jgi:uncharacterized membrane protein YuzA (DUF378 family)
MSVFRRKKQTKVEEVRDAVVSAAKGDVLAGAARRFSERGPAKLDTYVAGAVLIGMANWLSMALFNFDIVKAIAGRKSMSGRTAYGLIGLGGIYAAIRGARKAA